MGNSSDPPEVPPPLLLGALRPGMLRLAGREADGAAINWLGAEDVPRVVAEVAAGSARATGGVAPSEIVARIYCCPSQDAQGVRRQGRKLVGAYLNVEVYARFQEWLGRGDLLRPMWEAWSAGDRVAAVAAIPDEVVDSLIVHGTPESCRAHIRRYVENGVTTPVVALLPWGLDQRRAIRELSPAAG